MHAGKKRAAKKLKSIEQLQKTQFYKRINDIKDTIINKFNCALSIFFRAVGASKRAPAEQMMHLDTATRKKARTIDRALFQSETRIIKLRRQWADEKGTRTRAKKIGEIAVAWVTDPITLFAEIGYTTPFLVVGADRGGEQTKLGVTVQSTLGTTIFIPLVVTSGKDDYGGLSLLNTADCLKFTGATALAKHRTIFSVLNYFLSLPLEFTGLNGDWNSMSALLGLSTATATHPCLICTITTAQFQSGLHHANPRTPLDGRTEFCRRHPPLIKAKPEQIVPLPLHILLGIGNRIIKYYKTVFGKKLVKRARSESRTLGTKGRSRVHTLSGKEIRTWIRQNQCKRLCEASGVPFERIRVLSSWLTGLYDHLLPKSKATRESIALFSKLVRDIQQNWRGQTGTNPIPKIHMLTHAEAFFQQNSFLGRYSESALESAHHDFNRLFEVTHRNSIHKPLRRTRRCLADTIVAQIAAALKQ